MVYGVKDILLEYKGILESTVFEQSSHTVSKYRCIYQPVFQNRDTTYQPVENIPALLQWSLFHINILWCPQIQYNIPEI